MLTKELQRLTALFTTTNTTRLLHQHPASWIINKLKQWVTDGVNLLKMLPLLLMTGCMDNFGCRFYFLRRTSRKTSGSLLRYGDFFSSFIYREELLDIHGNMQDGGRTSGDFKSFNFYQSYNWYIFLYRWHFTIIAIVSFILKNIKLTNICQKNNFHDLFPNILQPPTPICYNPAP